MPARIGPKKRNLSPHFFREWRDERGLSQAAVLEKLAEIGISCSKASLSRIENRKQPFSQDILDGLAIVYRCTRLELQARDPRDPRSVRAVMDQILNTPTTATP